MKLSIIIPVYRVEATLNRCVESVTNQSFDDFEVILVDDGSPDKCPQMCDEWAQKDPRITVIHQTNAGLSAARNAGIDRAQGDYLTFVDSDDFIGTETLGEVVEQLDDNDILEYPVAVSLARTVRNGYGSKTRPIPTWTTIGLTPRSIFIPTPATRSTVAKCLKR